VQYVFMHMIIYSSDIAAKSQVQPTLKRAAIKCIMPRVKSDFSGAFPDTTDDCGCQQYLNPD